MVQSVKSNLQLFIAVVSLTALVIVTMANAPIPSTKARKRSVPSPMPENTALENAAPENSISKNSNSLRGVHFPVNHWSTDEQIFSSARTSPSPSP